MGEIWNLPSSFVNEAFAPVVRACDAAAAAAFEEGGGGGTALPGPRVGNLRVADWAGFEAFAPILYARMS